MIAAQLKHATPVDKIWGPKKLLATRRGMSAGDIEYAETTPPVDEAGHSEAKPAGSAGPKECHPEGQHSRAPGSRPPGFTPSTLSTEYFRDAPRPRYTGRMNQNEPTAPRQDRAFQIEKPAILKYFAYDHLPTELQEFSKPFAELANRLAAALPPSAELTAGLRKLLEAKDCFVRARLP